MKLLNATRKMAISNNIYLASSFLDTTFGLILKRDHDLHFKTRFGLHTFFMKRAIDIIIADRNLRVVKTKSDMRTNRIFIWNPIYFNVFELKAGMVDSTGTTVGDKLIIT